VTSSGPCSISKKAWGGLQIYGVRLLKFLTQSRGKYGGTKMRRSQLVRLGALIALCFLSVLPTVCQTTTTASSNSGSTPVAKPGQATGERIGNAISAAISTAFPEVQKIIDVIWPTNKNQSKNAAAATPPLTTANKTASVDQNKALTAIAQIADELMVMRTFLSYCVAADENVTAMQTILGKSTLSSKDLSDLKQDWNNASLRVAKLGSAEIQMQISGLKPSDPYVQQTLGNIADANLGLVQNITDELKTVETNPKSQEIDALRSNVNALKTALTGVNSLAGIVIGDVSLGLKSVPDILKGTMGAETADKTTQEQYDIFNERIRQLYPAKTK